MSDMRLSESGQAWQACPYCGLRRIVSARGIRAHNEFCNGALQPYMSILGNLGLVPFQREPWINPRTGHADPRVLGERPPMRWRVAPDQWYRLEAWARERHHVGFSGLPAMLFGWPIESDGSLPPESIVLEPA